MKQLILIAALLAAACGSDEEPPATDMSSGGRDFGADVATNPDMGAGADASTDSDTGMPVPQQSLSAVYGESVEGRPMLGEAFGSEGPLLFLLSAIHGNERLALTYGDRVRTRLLGGMAERRGIRVFFVQAANPDGIDADRRTNTNSIDLNRNFPAENFEAGGTHGEAPLTEPESQMLHDALNSTGPVGVVSIHCCVPTFDLDGPAIGLADAMDRAMYAASGLDFALEGLPAYGGSMGSYVSQILGRPIVTVEFARADEADAFLQMDGMDAAIDAALDWTAEQPTVDPFAPDTMRALDVAYYSSATIGVSASGIPIRSEIVGDGLRHVALLAGFDGTDTRGEFVAEHVRRRLLADFTDSTALVITGVNPDGIHFQSPENANRYHVRDELGLPAPVAPEALAVRAAMAQHAPELAVVVVDSNRDAFSVLGDPRQLDGRVDEGELSSPPSAVDWLDPIVDGGTTVLLVEVATAYAEAQSSSPVDLTSPTAVGDIILEALR